MRPNPPPPPPAVILGSRGRLVVPQGHERHSQVVPNPEGVKEAQKSRARHGLLLRFPHS